MQPFGDHADAHGTVHGGEVSLTSHVMRVFFVGAFLLRRFIFLQDKLKLQTSVNLQFKSVGNLVKDTWLSWARRMLRLIKLTGKKLAASDKGAQWLQSLGVAWNGAMNKNVAQALASMQNTLSEESLLLLRELEMRHTAAVLTDDYSKLNRVLKIVTGCSALNEVGVSADEAFQYVVRAMMLAMNRAIVTAAFFSVSVLDPGSGKNGWVAVSLGRARTVLWIQKIVGHMKDSKAKDELQSLLSDFLDPLAFDQARPPMHAVFSGLA